MSNVSTDFISLPGLTSSSIMTSPTPASAGLKNRSQSLMVKVRRGTLFRPRGRTESFDLVEQRTATAAAFNNKGQQDSMINENKDSSKKKSCLKLKMTKNKGKARGKGDSDTNTEKNVKNPAMRTVSFDARAASLSIPLLESNPLFDKEAADSSTQRFQITKTRQELPKKICEIDWSHLCLQ